MLQKFLTVIISCAEKKGINEFYKNLYAGRSERKGSVVENDGKSTVYSLSDRTPNNPVNQLECCDHLFLLLQKDGLKKPALVVGVRASSYAESPGAMKDYEDTYLRHGDMI